MFLKKRVMTQDFQIMMAKRSISFYIFFLLLFSKIPCFGQDYLIIPSTYSEVTSKYLLMISKSLEKTKSNTFSWKIVNLSFGNANLFSCCELGVTSALNY